MLPSIDQTRSFVTGKHKICICSNIFLTPWKLPQLLGAFYIRPKHSVTGLGRNAVFFITRHLPWYRYPFYARNPSPRLSGERNLVHELMIKHHTFHLTYQPRAGLARFVKGLRFYRSSSGTLCVTGMQIQNMTTKTTHVAQLNVNMSAILKCK